MILFICLFYEGVRLGPSIIDESWVTFVGYHFKGDWQYINFLDFSVNWLLFVIPPIFLCLLALIDSNSLMYAPTHIGILQDYVTAAHLNTTE